MPHFNINIDSKATSNLLETAPVDCQINLATGYFNLTNQYINSILRHSKAQYRILCAHPTANGFLGAPGFAGGIPAAYTNLCKHFFEKISKKLHANRILMYEYQRDEWTFHAKGLWYFPEGDATPSTTLIGSPNFGYRSVYRDLETQLLVSTTCPALRQDLAKEQLLLYDTSSQVTASTFDHKDRLVPLWVKLVTYFMKFFF
ncbi:UNVERIFIED_CONTAM: hypothetical protein GTU68_025767 [Idotea baltica]|nr:hypothetical protein [Idotea baltica]